MFKRKVLNVVFDIDKAAVQLILTNITGQAVLSQSRYQRWRDHEKNCSCSIMDSTDKCINIRNPEF